MHAGVHGVWILKSFAAECNFLNADLGQLNRLSACAREFLSRGRTVPRWREILTQGGVRELWRSGWRFFAWTASGMDWSLAGASLEGWGQRGARRRGPAIDRS